MDKNAEQSETISINECIASQMFARGGFDETNAHLGFRKAQRNIRSYLRRSGWCNIDFDTQLEMEEIDSIIIFATNNGGRGLFDNWRN